MAADLVKGMSAGDISKLFATAADTQAKAGFLKILATSGAKAGLDPAKQAMKHESPASDGLCRCDAQAHPRTPHRQTARNHP